MKKIIALALVALLCLSLFSIGALAVDDPTIRISTVEAAPGDTDVTVTVSLENNPGIMMLELSIQYDETRLEKTSFAGQGLDDILVNTGATWIGSADSTYNGTILTLTFKVLDDAPVGAASVSVTCDSCANLAEEPISFAVVSGGVTVSAAEHAHSWNDGEVTTPETCTVDGVMTYTCTVVGCGATKTETIPAAGHTWDDGEETTPATCTVDGVKTYTCIAAGCGATKTEAIPATGHTWDDGEETTPATCTEDGVMTYTCIAAGCGATKTEAISATGHALEEAEDNGDGTHTGTCPNCDAEVTENHAWDGGKVTTAATTSAKGVKTYTCTVCGATKTEDIPMLASSSSSKPAGADKAPKTGDEGRVGLDIALVALCAAGLCAAVVCGKKRRSRG